MHRIFIDHHQISENHLQLDHATAHHLLTVCRLSMNDTVELVVNQDRLLQVKILSIEGHQLEISILDQWALNAHRTFQISLIQALSKQDKFTDVCRMCTELGVSSFHPVKTQYCDVKVLSVNTLNQNGKIKKFRNISGKRPDFKKAFVKLAEGNTIDTTVEVK